MDPIRVSPSFMAVIPTSSNVKIVFETSIFEKILNFASIIIFFVAINLIRKRYKKNV